MQADGLTPDEMTSLFPGLLQEQGWHAPDSSAAHLGSSAAPQEQERQWGDTHTGKHPHNTRKDLASVRSIAAFDRCLTCLYSCNKHKFHASAWRSLQ